MMPCRALYSGKAFPSLEGAVTGEGVPRRARGWVGVRFPSTLEWLGQSWARRLAANACLLRLGLLIGTFARSGLRQVWQTWRCLPSSSSCCDSKHHESAAPTTDDVRAGRKFSVSPMTRLCCGLIFCLQRICLCHTSVPISQRRWGSTYVYIQQWLFKVYETKCEHKIIPSQQAQYFRNYLFWMILNVFPLGKKAFIGKYDFSPETKINLFFCNLRFFCHAPFWPKLFVGTNRRTFRSPGKKHEVRHLHTGGPRMCVCVGYGQVQVCPFRRRLEIGWEGKG